MTDRRDNALDTDVPRSDNRIEVQPDEPCPCDSGKQLSECCLKSGGKFQPPHCNTLPPSPQTGYSNHRCYAAGLADCSTSISREHYVAAGLLERLKKHRGELIQVTGFPWSKHGKAVSVKGLASKILCERHNNALSSLDAIGIRIFDSVARIQSDFRSGLNHDAVFLFNGHDIERWLLKMLCGMAVAKNAITAKGEDIRWQPEPSLLDILFGLKSFPHYCGLWCGVTETNDSAEHSVSFTPHVSSDRQRILATAFVVPPFRFITVVEHPFEGMERILPGLRYHPELLVFRSAGGKKVIMLRWDESDPVQ